MFYQQLLHAKIPKVQKKRVKLSVFFALSGSECAKAACKTLMKLTPGGLVTQPPSCITLCSQPAP